MSRAEMQQLGWDSCDVIIIGDAYVDHPSFGMAVIGRSLRRRAAGRDDRPADWSSKEPFMALGKPNLFSASPADAYPDSMISRYTADKKLRHDDAYTSGNGGAPPRRAVLVYTQRLPGSL